MKELRAFVTAFSLVTLFEVGVDGQSCSSQLVTDFNQENCTSQENEVSSFYYWTDETSCLPYCAQYDPAGHKLQDCPCPPAYVCTKRCKNAGTPCTTDDDCAPRDRCDNFCEAGLGSCMAYHANTFDFNTTFYSAKKFKPKCTTDGVWEAKQCKGGVSGRCFCFDSVGKRLFGQAEYHESTNMTCACSRRRADLLNSGRHYVSLHCDSKGNFEELQCASNLCWCVEPQTGEVTAPVVPEKAMYKLPCYKSADVGGQYLRKCDSLAYAMSYATNKLKVRGMQYVNLGNVQCDGDGAYGAYNLSEGIARCTWRDGTQIGTWQSDASTDISKLNCNCARDFKMYSHMLKCDGAGNYDSVQYVIDEDVTSYFCVDPDGFPKSEMFNDRIGNCTLYY